MEGDGGSSVLVPFGSLGGEGAVDVGGDGCISVCPTAGGGVSAGTGGAAVATGWDAWIVSPEQPRLGSAATAAMSMRRRRAIMSGKGCIRRTVGAEP
jgi:hypothetical protein